MRARLGQDTRGASLVEYIVLVGVVALVAIAGASLFGGVVERKAEQDAACVVALDGACGAAPQAPPPGSSAASATSGSSAATPSDPRAVVGNWGVRIIGGFVSQGLDTVKDLGTIALAATPPGLMHSAITGKPNAAVDAVVGVSKLALSVTMPGRIVAALGGPDPARDTAQALGQRISAAWKRDKADTIGRGAFEVVGALLPLTKARAAIEAGEAARIAARAGEVAISEGALERAAADAAAVGSRAAEAGAGKLVYEGSFGEGAAEPAYRGMGELSPYPLEAGPGPKRVVTLLGDDEKMRDITKGLNLPEGTTTVVVHGDYDGFEVKRAGQAIRLNQRQLAKYIDANGAGGKGALVLFSCDTGCGDLRWPVAQDLANKTGREVWAPTGDIKAFRNEAGQSLYFIGFNVKKNGWRRFTPMRPPPPEP